MEIPKKILGFPAIVAIGAAVLFYFKYLKNRNEAS